MNIDISVKRIKRSCEEVCQTLKAMSHPQRLLILGHLLSGEKTVSELVDLCQISQSQMSQFLLRMKMEGLVHCRRESRYQYYSVADKRLEKLMRLIQHEFCNC